MINSGGVSVSYYSEPFPLILTKCQRYLCKSFNYGVKFGTVSAIGGAVFTGVSATLATGTASYPSRMRAVPSATSVYNPVSGTAGTTFNQNTSAAAGVTVALSQIGDSSFTALSAASG